MVFSGASEDEAVPRDSLHPDTLASRTLAYVHVHTNPVKSVTYPHPSKARGIIVTKMKLTVEKHRAAYEQIQRDWVEWMKTTEGIENPVRVRTMCMII